MVGSLSCSFFLLCVAHLDWAGSISVCLEWEGAAPWAENGHRKGLDAALHVQQCRHILLYHLIILINSNNTTPFLLNIWYWYPTAFLSLSLFAQTLNLELIFKLSPPCSLVRLRFFLWSWGGQGMNSSVAGLHIWPPLWELIHGDEKNDVNWW